MGHVVTLLIFLLILGLIVFIHEFGHFITAKLNKVFVHEFSLGFGPKLFSFRRKNDETEYMIKTLPLGGYVMLAGEEYDEDEEDDKKDKKGKKKEKVIVPEDQKLYNKKFHQKLIIMVAGVFNNFVLGLILLFIMGLVWGCDFSNNKLSHLNKDLPLYEAGARNGDKLVSINGHKVKNDDDILLYVAINGMDKPLNVEVEKKDTKKIEKYKIKAKALEKDGDKYFGISVKTNIKKGFFVSIKYAFVKISSIFKQLIVIIISLFQGKIGLNSVSGPVGIYSVVDMAKGSMILLIYLTAYLSINVGFMNLLPFPAFDGGRAFLLIVEKIIRKKVPLKVESIINGVGFVLLMILMVIITIKDIINLF